MRLAWFSPTPPARTGIAACSADLLGALAVDHDIDLYVDEPLVQLTRAAARRGTHPAPTSAHDFVWRHARDPYDLTVYQLGNSSHHDYQWPYLFRYPGLAVLHDAHLHHARAAALLRERRASHYRDEFAANAAEVSRDAAELAIAGFDSAMYYEWPFTHLVVRTSRATAVHSPVVRRWLRGEHPGATVEFVRLGHGTSIGPDEVAARGAAARARLGIPAGAILFGCFGGIAPEKRVPQILKAFEAVLAYVSSARLLLAGPVAPHYDLGADLARQPLRDRVVATGYVSDEDLTAGIAACDVTLNLRWPTAREISGPWLRCLAAGRPSIIVDLAQTSHVPALDPRTWTATGDGRAEPVSVAVDILDEEHSLRLAMRRLGTDAALRGRLGEAARRYWTEHHEQAGMVADYQRVLRQAASAPVLDVPLPAHLRDDRTGALAAMLAPFGVPAPWSKI